MAIGHIKKKLTEENICSDELIVDDTNCLAAHALLCHDIKHSKGSNNLYRFSIVQKLCDPKLLLRREQFYINEYRTLIPLGLNLSNPIGLQALIAMK